jgi:hypothetical protein
VVTTSDGKPAPNCTVVVIDPGGGRARVITRFMRIEGGSARASCGEDGSFRFPKPDRAYYILAINERGVAVVYSDTFAQQHQIVLEDWGAVRGRLHVGENIGAEQSIYVHPQRWTNENGDLIGSVSILRSSAHVR